MDIWVIPSFLTVTVKAAMNIDVQVFVCVCFFSSEYVFRSRVSALCDTSIFITFRGTAKLFSKVTIPYYFLPAMQETQFLHILIHVFLPPPPFFIIVILVSVSWFLHVVFFFPLHVVLIYISLITKDVENIFMCLLAIYVPFFWKIYFQIVCLFLIELSFCYRVIGV